MRHHNNVRKFGRKVGGRKALMKSLAENFILRGKITTTEAKAKELRPYVEKLITKSKTDTLLTRRVLKSKLFTDKAVTKLSGHGTKTYADRAGGYTRVTKLPIRKSDSAKMATLELV